MINPAFELLVRISDRRWSPRAWHRASRHRRQRPALELFRVRGLDLVAAVLVPIGVALALGAEPWSSGRCRRRPGPGGRHRCASRHGATEQRPPLAALVAAASFDFLLTRPYGSFRISRQSDITTELLFVAVGLLVGELAARGRRHQRAAASGRREISRIHDLERADRRGRGARVRPDGSCQRAASSFSTSRTAASSASSPRERGHGSPATAPYGSTRSAGPQPPLAFLPARSSSRFEAAEDSWARSCSPPHRSLLSARSSAWSRSRWSTNWVPPSPTTRIEPIASTIAAEGMKLR